MKKTVLWWYTLSIVFHLYGEPIFGSSDDGHETCPISQALAAYVKYGNKQYMLGESVTQESHALQTAYLLKNVGAPQEVIAAGFLHDIGQLIDQDHLGNTHYLHIHHADLGADWLKKRWYPELIVDCARYHTLAKIHLCKTNASYQRLLSPASQESLLIQQQHYTAEQYQQFLALPYLTTLLAIRKCDDMAKQPNFDALTLGDMIPHLCGGYYALKGLPIVPTWMHTIDEQFAAFAVQQGDTHDEQTADASATV